GHDVAALDGKIAVVTGAGNGIARATAIVFAREGASVVVNDVDAAGVETTIATIREQGGKAVPCVVAVGDQPAAELLVRTALDSFGDLDVMVNIAGVYAPAPIEEMTPDMFERVVRVHLFGTFYNAQAAAK